jgi:hypothetical protein
MDFSGHMLYGQFRMLALFDLFEGSKRVPHALNFVHGFDLAHLTASNPVWIDRLAP